MVFASERSPVATAEAVPEVRGGSGTFRNRGMEKTSHHTATVMKEICTAAALSGIPNVAGERTIATLIANRIPPPM